MQHAHGETVEWWESTWHKRQVIRSDEILIALVMVENGLTPGPTAVVVKMIMSNKDLGIERLTDVVWEWMKKGYLTTKCGALLLVF